MAYIEREKARELIINFGKGAIEDGMKTLGPVDDIILLSSGVDLIPTADVVEVRHGEWVKDRATIKCSCCGFGMFQDGYFFMDGECFSTNNDKYTPNYCPECGAKMDGKDYE